MDSEDRDSTDRIPGERRGRGGERAIGQRRWTEGEIQWGRGDKG